MQRILHQAASYGAEDSMFSFPLESRTKLAKALQEDGYASWNIMSMSEDKFTAISGGLPLSIHRAIINAALDAYPVSTITGLAMLEPVERSLITFSFGPNSSMLDEITHGGIWTSEVTEIVGPSGCGKTQLSLQIAGQCACSPTLPCKVLYIDTSLSFHPDRLMEMHRHWMQHDPKMLSAATMFSQIKIAQAADCFELMNVLEQTRESLTRQHTEFTRELRVIIIDSIAAVLSPILGIPGRHGHAWLTEIACMLKCLARKFNLAVLVTNNVVANRDAEVSRDTVLPALGELWSHVPDTRIVLQEIRDPVNATEEKDRKLNHRRSLVGRLAKSAKFCVGEEVLLNIRAMGITNVSR